MRKILIISSMLMMSFAVSAQEAETCANGAGTVITGAVTGHKYCKSNGTMNWWNAHAWCDALGRRLFDRSDCACGNTTADCANGKCPELVGVGGEQWIWTSTPTPTGSSYAYIVSLSSGHIVDNYYRSNLFSAFCY